MTADTTTSHRLTALQDGIYCLDTEYHQPGIAALYLMRQNDRVAIIETGTSYCVPVITNILTQWGLDANAVDYVIPTHVHLDHAGGAGALIRACPNAQLIVHPKGARHLIAPEKLIAGTIAVYGEAEFQALYGEIVPVPAQRVIDAGDNYSLDFHGRQLTFIDTPGHARHHFCVHDSRSKGIFTGDTFGLCYPELETRSGPFILATTTPVQFEPEALLESIDKLMAFHPEVMFLTHFGPVKPEADLVGDLKKTIEVYTSIAQSEKQAVADRANRIETRMMQFLTERMQLKGMIQDKEFCHKKLANDVRLNSQGLDIWLDRQER